MYRAFLEKFFIPESILVESIYVKYCNYDQLPYEMYYQDINDLLVNKSYRKGRVVYLFPNLKNNKGIYDYYKGGAHIHTDKLDKLWGSAGRSVRKTLQFRPEIMSKVTEIFDNVASEMGLMKQDITFVGIHNRRTDHLEFSEKMFRQKPLGPEYFKEKMNEFRADYNNIAFLFVSDDMEWGRENLDEEENIFFAGSGIDDDDFAIGVDYATLANCNHSIISRGTFSLTSSYFVGGEIKCEVGNYIPEELTNPNFIHEEYIL